MTQLRFCWWMVVGLVLLGIPHHSSAEQNQPPAVVQGDAQGKVTRDAKNSGNARNQPPAVVQEDAKGKVARDVKNSGNARNPLHPFTLRLLYTPSYRFLHRRMQDILAEVKMRTNVTMEIAQFFPVAAGLEVEFAFSELVSLAVGGNFSWHDELITWDALGPLEALVPTPDYDYREFVGWLSLYFNVANYFNLGMGVGLTQVALEVLQHGGSEKDKRYGGKSELSWKEMSGHLALRRDFFWSRWGVGIGLNASLPLIDTFDRHAEHEKHVWQDGEPSTVETDDSKVDDDIDMYSLVLMPMFYVAF